MVNCMYPLRNNRMGIPELSAFWLLTMGADAEDPILWPPEAKSQFIGKDPDAGKDWRQEEKGETEDGRHHWLNGHEFKQTLSNSEGQGNLVCCSPQSCRVGHDWVNNSKEWLFQPIMSSYFCWYVFSLSKSPKVLNIKQSNTEVNFFLPSQLSGQERRKAKILDEIPQCFALGLLALVPHPSPSPSHWMSTVLKRTEDSTFMSLEINSLNFQQTVFLLSCHVFHTHLILPCEAS